MEKKEFKAESRRLLDLMINSIYTHKEIFLRELISNASDACDKLCYQALTDDSVGMSRQDFQIHLTLDPEQRLLTVSDNGIGMSQEDLEENLGVIASSGTFRFRQEVVLHIKPAQLLVVHCIPGHAAAVRAACQIHELGQFRFPARVFLHLDHSLKDFPPPRIQPTDLLRKGIERVEVRDALEIGL